MLDQILPVNAEDLLPQVFVDGLGFPASGSRVGQVDHLASTALLGGEDLDVNFGASSERGFESEAELFDQDDASFGVFILHGGSLVAVFGDGLVVGGEVGVLDVIVGFPVIILE
jgi:hypothetical protein